MNGRHQYQCHPMQPLNVIGMGSIVKVVPAFGPQCRRRGRPSIPRSGRELKGRFKTQPQKELGIPKGHSEGSHSFGGVTSTSG